MAVELTKDQFEALKAYAAENGRTWKSKLIDDWMTCRSEGELQQIRNNFGSRWLMKFRFTDYGQVAA